MALSTIALLGLGLGAAGATAGAIGSSVNRNKSQKERTRAYENAKDFLSSEYYRDPLSSVGTRALLKSMDERLKDQTDALNNRAVAGGATMENQLAARKANNETMSGAYSRLLMGEDARRQAVQQQKFQLDQNYSAGIQSDFRQAAQDWQTWGAQMAGAGMDVFNAYGDELIKK